MEKGKEARILPRKVVHLGQPKAEWMEKVKEEHLANEMEPKKEMQKEMLLGMEYQQRHRMHSRPYLYNLRRRRRLEQQQSSS
jgi:hypothetical protein